MSFEHSGRNAFQNFFRTEVGHLMDGFRNPVSIIKNHTQASKIRNHRQRSCQMYVRSLHQVSLLSKLTNCQLRLFQAAEEHV